MNTASASVLVRRWVFAAASAFALVVGTAHCSSSSGGGSACDSVCDCVASKNGDRSNCMQQCGQISAKSSNLKSDCESALAANGYSSCSSTCSAFTKGGSGTTNLSAFCAKCESCVGETGFDEGFCDPFKTSKGFDVEACEANGDVKQLKNPTLSASQLSTMSCKAFDDAE